MSRSGITKLYGGPIGAALIAAAVAIGPARAQPAPPAAAPAPLAKVIQPEAVALLKATSAALTAARSLGFTAVVSYEYPTKLGPPIVTTVRYDVAFERPNHLRVTIPADGPPSEFTYDGKQIIAYSPDKNLAATAAAPPALAGALTEAFQKADIYFPFTDFLLDDPYKVISEGADMAFVVGPSEVVGGVKTQQVVWSGDEMFMQIWIGAEDKLPRRIRAIWADDPRQLRHDMTLTDWQVNPTFPAGTFDAAKAKTAQKMPFASPAGPPPPPPAALAKAASK